MKNTLRFIVILFSISIYSCQKEDCYIITGNVTGFPDSTMIYLENQITYETFDSSMIIGNKFQFIGCLQYEPEQIFVNATVNNEMIYTVLLIGNETVNIEGDITDFPWNLEITGSKTQDEFSYLLGLTRPFDLRRDSIVQSFMQLPPEIQQEKGQEIMMEMKKLGDTSKALQIEYIKSNFNTYPGIIYLGYFKNEMPKDTVQAIYNKLSSEIKASKYAKIVDIYLNEKITEIGDTYHDFVAENKNGETIRFSDLIGKYILLDFTAAYCRPCILSIDELKLIERTYSDSLEIVSFSGDVSKNTWLKSLERDNISWLSLWDGKGTYSETYIKYGVQGFPAFFLIDPNGRIIDKWKGYGKGTLEAKLSRFKLN